MNSHQIWNQFSSSVSFPFVKEFCATHVIWIKIIMFGVFVVNKKKKKTVHRNFDSCHCDIFYYHSFVCIYMYNNFFSNHNYDYNC